MATHRTLAELLGRTPAEQHTEHDPDQNRPQPVPAPEPEPEPQDQPVAPEAHQPATQRPAALDEQAQPDGDQPGAQPQVTAEPQPAGEPQPAAEPQARRDRPGQDAGSAPVVHTPEPGAAERVTLYLHPDDHRALGLAKLDDRIDHNTRIRAMIALWRADPEAVDRLAAEHKST